MLYFYKMYFTLTANRQPIMDVLFFSMKGTRNRGNRSNYRKLLSEETLLDETSLQNAMLDRENNNGFKLVYIFVISGMRLQSIKMMMNRLLLLTSYRTEQLSRILWRFVGQERRRWSSCQLQRRVPVHRWSFH